MALPTKSSSPMDVTPGLAALQGMPIGSETQETQDAIDKGIKALEARYASPNWFNVAAGFFKPQLGGFSASLGSASQALGDFQEQQRANQIPVFNAQMQGQAVIAGRQGKIRANELLAAQDPNKPISADVLRRVRILDPSEEVYNAGLAKNTEYTRLAQQKGTQVNTGVTQAEGLTKFPSELFKPVPLDLSGSNAEVPEAASLKNNLVATASKIPGAPEGLENLTIGQLQDFLGENREAQREAAFTNRTTAAKEVEAANVDLQNKMELRRAIDAPGIERILNSNKYGDVLSILTNFYTSQSGDNAKNYATLLNSIKANNPDDYRAFEILNKKLSQDVVSARSMLNNPSNGATALVSSGNPSIANSQDAMRAMVDLSAHELSSRAQRALFSSQYKGNVDTLPQDNLYKALNNNLFDQREGIVAKKPTFGVPKYYNIYGSLDTNTSATAPKDDLIRRPSPEPSATPNGGKTKFPTAQELLNKHLPPVTNPKP